MTARAGMAELIDELRLMTDTVSSEDSEVTDYWTDEQLQDILDSFSVYHVRVPLRPVLEMAANGRYEPRTYTIPRSVSKWLERDSVENRFQVQTVKGLPLLVGAGEDDYIPDYKRGVIIFNTPTRRQSYYLTAYGYDLNRAAADVWHKKAGLRVPLIQWKTDNHTLYEDQEYTHCMDKYIEYSSKAGPLVTRFIRVDEAYYRAY